MEELKLAIAIRGPFKGFDVFSNTIDCLNELIATLDHNDEYKYSLPRAISFVDYGANELKRLLQLDAVDNDKFPPIVTRVQVRVEHPGGVVCLQTGLKNVFCVDETFEANPDIQYTHINDDGKILNYLGTNTLASSFLDDTVLCFLESRKVRRLLDGLSVEKRDIHFMCFPHLRCQGNTLLIAGFSFMPMTGSSNAPASFDMITDETISFHHVLEEAMGVANRCGSCGKKLPMDANYCSHCAKETKKRKLEREE